MGTAADSTAEPAWDVRASGGRQLNGLPLGTAAAGLREGWLSPSDEARMSGEGAADDPWKPFADVAKAAFPVHVLIDPPAAHARRAARVAAFALGVVNAVAGFLAATSEYLDVTIGRAALVLPLVVGGFLLLAKAPNVVVVGLTFTVVAVALRAVSGKDLAFGSALAVVVGGFVGLVLAGGLGAGVGYGAGYCAGLLWGRARRRRYELPDVRRDIPDAVLEAHSA